MSTIEIDSKEANRRASGTVHTDAYEWAPGKRRRETRELWKRRELLSFFIWKEFTIRYKQTAIGVLWVVLQPLCFALLFSAVILRDSSIGFGLIEGSNFVPLYLGMCYWLMVSTAVMNGSNALLGNIFLLNKVYVPRQIPVLSTTLLSGVDFIFAVSLVPVFALLTKTPIHPVGFLLSVLVAVPLLLATYGLVLILASAVVRFRDIRFIVPYVVNVLFFFSSALFPLALYSRRWRDIILSNPIAATIDWCRHQTFGVPTSLTQRSITVAMSIAVGMLVVGLLVFKRTSRNLVEQL